MACIVSKPLRLAKCIIQPGKRGDDGRLRSKNEIAQRRLVESRCGRRGELFVSPATFGPNRQRHLSCSAGGQNRSHRPRFGTFGEEQLKSSGTRKRRAGLFR